MCCSCKVYLLSFCPLFMLVCYTDISVFIFFWSQRKNNDLFSRSQSFMTVLVNFQLEMNSSQNNGFLSIWSKRLDAYLLFCTLSRLIYYNFHIYDLNSKILSFLSTDFHWTLSADSCQKNNKFLYLSIKCSTYY